MTKILTLKEGDPNIEQVAIYSIPAKQALIAYVMQLKGDYNTWTYPENLEGIRESDTAPGHFYFDAFKRDGFPCEMVIAAYPA